MPLIPFLRLIRPVNLLMILYIQFTLFIGLLYPVLNTGWLVPYYTVFAFSFVFMAAAGYIINDYYDVEIDKINKPRRLIIGASVKPNIALAVYWILSTLGIIFGLYMCYSAGLAPLGLIFPIYFVGLWYYSKTLKYKPIIGNLLISFFIALVPYAAGTFLLFNTHLLYSVFKTNWIMGISVFAFLTTFVREVLKDAEDIEGDSKAGCKTIPIVFGLHATKKITQVILIILIVALIVVDRFMYKAGTTGVIHGGIPIASFLYVALFLQVPIVYLVYLINKATSANDFHSISSWLKAVMFLGITYQLLFPLFTIE